MIKNNYPKIIAVIIAIILALLIFKAGVFVGFHKAAFSYNMGARYYKALHKNKMPSMMSFKDGDNFPNSHGAIGKIIKLDEKNIIIEDRENTEKIINITTSTLIKNSAGLINLIDLNPGDAIIIFGKPNEKSEIEAKLIRVLGNQKTIEQIENTTSTKN